MKSNVVYLQVWRQFFPIIRSCVVLTKSSKLNYIGFGCNNHICIYPFNTCVNCELCLK